MLQWHGEVIQETGGDLLLMHYEDLYNMLYKLAMSRGVKLTLGAKIRSVQYDETLERPTAIMEDGTVHVADVIVGADGYNSVVRGAVTGLPDPGVETGMCFYSLVVPAEKLEDDPDWSPLLKREEWPIWMGSGRSLLAYPIRNGKELSVHAYIPDTAVKRPALSEDWSDVVPTCDISHGNAHPSIVRLFQAVPDAIRVKYVIREILDDWVDESGTICVIGEAAHALLPCTVHNISLAVEDAAVLGTLLGHVRERKQIPQLLQAYHDLRFSRVQQVHHSELYNAAFATLPPGEHRDQRNAGLKQTLSLDPTADMDDEALAEQWEDISFVFGYNATEDAEDWWYKWGAIGEAARDQPTLQSMFSQMSMVQVDHHVVP